MQPKFVSDLNDYASSDDEEKKSNDNGKSNEWHANEIFNSNLNSWLHSIDYILAYAHLIVFQPFKITFNYHKFLNS